MIGDRLINDLKADLRFVWSDVRCTHCGRLLMKWNPTGVADVNIKCPRCGKLDTVHLTTG